jgi:hypothetical protein
VPDAVGRLAQHVGCLVTTQVTLRRIAWTIAALAAAAAVGVAVNTILSQRGPADVDRATYVLSNVRLLAQLPQYPGARRIRLESEPLRAYEDMTPLVGYSYVHGYNTYATFQTPGPTRSEDVISFFDDRMPEWRIASRTTIPEGWPHVLKGRRNLEQRCYALHYASVCIDMAGFLDRGIIVSGGSFTIAVDHRAYEPR